MMEFKLSEEITFAKDGVDNKTDIITAKELTQNTIWFRNYMNAVIIKQSLSLATGRSGGDDEDEEIQSDEKKRKSIRMILSTIENIFKDFYDKTLPCEKIFFCGNTDIPLRDTHLKRMSLQDAEDLMLEAFFTFSTIMKSPKKE